MSDLIGKALFPSGPNIFKIQSQSFPEFLFEYHVTSKKVYVVPIGQTTFVNGEPCHEAQLIGVDVLSTDAAKVIVQGFIMGYKMGQSTPNRLVIK